MVAAVAALLAVSSCRGSSFLGNRAPATVEAFADVTLIVGGGVTLTDVAPYFSDPDDDRLTYAAVSSHTDTVVASATGNTVSLTPVSAGTATVTVSASDGSVTATQTIAVTVQGPEVENRAPQAVGSIAAQTLTVGVDTRRVDVGGYFRAPDHDRLTYAAVSSHTDTVVASATGSTVSLTPVSAGTATVTVSASDGSVTATQTIAVAVREPEVENRAPQAVGSIAAQTLTVGADTRRVDVGGYFRAPDHDRLTYAAVSSHTDTVVASATGSTVSLTPVSAGTATVTVSASDGSVTATQTIAVTVREPEVENRAPQAVGSIAAQTLTVGADTRRVDVGGYFRAPDHDRLTYAAVSSRMSTVVASATGSTVSLTPVSARTATVTVSASDGSVTATQTIAVTVREPDLPLTGVSVELYGSLARKTSILISPVPAGARFQQAGISHAPIEAGSACCSFAGASVHIEFACAESYVGDVTLTAVVEGRNGRTFEASVIFTCQ